jgi:sulfite exporter TauE/SafE/copper chaperone CopZ
MKMKTQTIRVGGMTCASCQNRIEKKLKSSAGVEEVTVDFHTGTAAVTYNAAIISFAEIATTVESLGYTVAGEKGKLPAPQIIGTLVIILSLYVLLQGMGTSVLASAFPLAEAGMGYGMVFIIGLITSVHCVAMCGGINLSQCLRADGGRETMPDSGSLKPIPTRRALSATLLPATLYNVGRVISYTTVGTLVGALGATVTVSGQFQGVVQIAAGVFMVIMGINMLGIFPVLRRFNLRMPKIFAKKIDAQKAGSRNPLIIGLLNGLMPCGPLQAMQLYALSTGSPIAGGISMFLFSLGTVPLMFGLGAISSALSAKFARRVMRWGAILVTVLGLTMFTNGWNLAGFLDPFDTLTAFFISPGGGGDSVAFTPVIQNGMQIVNSTLSPGRYPTITVQQGIPVKWTINAPQGSINGCNNRIFIREYGIEHRFKQGENVIEFTPERTGKFTYSCWMGMIRSSIRVLAEDERVAEAPEPSLEPAPAGVTIPSDDVAVAVIRESQSVTYQVVTISLRDEGFSPSVLILQKGLPALWNITNESLDPGNGRLVVPAYYSLLDIRQGDNEFRLMPEDDFDFSTGDHVFYGYVKVVEDLKSVDIEAIKKDVSEFETKIYPDAYFEAASGANCCRS